jgi:hypothetical protein
VIELTRSKVNRITIYNKTRKIIALFLLAILVVVNIQKTLHHHDTNSCHSSNKQQADFSILEKDAPKFLAHEVECSLCDYYFAKDATIDFTTYSLSPVRQFNITFGEFVGQEVLDVKYYIENKGPPAQF